MKLRHGLIAALLLLTGCQTLNTASVDSGGTPSASNAADQTLQAAGFRMHLTVPPGGRFEQIRLYTGTQPQPGAGLAWQLHQQDPGSFYAGFPCRVMAGDGCDPRYLASQRYATEQAQAVVSMLEALKRQQQADLLDVVAPGDAAPLMLKVAALSGEIDHLQTLDGPLSPAIQAHLQGRAAPTTSDPLIYYRQLARQAQTHWISAGAGPTQEYLAARYKSALKQSGCVRLRIASSVTREPDWLSVWPAVRGGRFRCQR